MNRTAQYPPRSRAQNAGFASSSGQRQVPPEVQELERLMDRWIQVGPFSIGLDGLLGLFPGLGDISGGLISAYIIGKAARDGVPKAALARMITNVAIDAVVGAVPLVGDLFDFVFKANTKNVQIYREALAGPRDAARDWGYVALFVGAALAIVAIPVALGVMLVMKLLGAAF